MNPSSYEVKFLVYQVKNVKSIFEFADELHPYQFLAIAEQCINLSCFLFSYLCFIYSNILIKGLMGKNILLWAKCRKIQWSICAYSKRVNWQIYTRTFPLDFQVFYDCLFTMAAWNWIFFIFRKLPIIFYWSMSDLPGTCHCLV